MRSDFLVFLIQLDRLLYPPFHFTVVETFVGEHLLNVAASAAATIHTHSVFFSKRKDTRRHAASTDTISKQDLEFLTQERAGWSGSYCEDTRQYPPSFRRLVPTWPHFNAGVEGYAHRLFIWQRIKSNSKR